MKDKCYLLPRGYGGTVLTRDDVIIRRTAGIGDAVAATVVADKLHAMGLDVTFQSATGIHCVLRRMPSIAKVAEVGGRCDIDLDNTYESDPRRTSKHFYDMFIAAANDQLRSRDLSIGKALNCRPRIDVSGNEVSAAKERFSGHPRPWIFVCPRSDSFNVRQVPDGIWMEAAKDIHGTCFWMGKHPAPPGIVDLKLRHLDNLIVWLTAADLLLTVDTGPLHIGAALGVPIVAINQSSSPELHISDQNDFSMVSPNLDCLNCQKNVCPKSAEMPPCQNVNPAAIAEAVNLRMKQTSWPVVGCVISVYRPETETLNRCLAAAIHQVDHIVVVRDTNGVFPPGATQHPKVRYITKMANDIGYGRKANHGARHTYGEHILFLNDDCFLHPGCVDELVKEMKDGVGMVAPLLRYPSGLIYHAGKVRSPGQKGWGHIDHNRYDPTYEQPTELENCCGACVLVKRKAFYDAGCFDEDFYLYAEDDALALAVRREGYKIMFAPKAQGIHLEHQSTSKTPFIVDIMHQSNRLFGQKWGKYLDWNANRVPLGNFDYLKA